MPTGLLRHLFGPSGRVEYRVCSAVSLVKFCNFTERLECAGREVRGPLYSTPGPQFQAVLSDTLPLPFPHFP